MTFRPRGASLLAWWDGLPGHIRGALLTLGSGVAATLMSATARYLGDRIPAAEVAFFRASFGWLSIMPFVVAAGPAVLRTARPGTHALRGFVGGISMLSSFYAVMHLPLADATTYSFTRGLFLVVLAALFLGEPFRYSRAIAIVAGFLGMLVMLRPQMGVEPAALVALGGAFFTAFSVMSVKMLMRTESPITVMFYFGLSSTLMTLLPALFVWVMPTWWELGLMLLAGALGSVNQSMFVRAYRVADATVLAPFEYMQVLTAALIGYLFFTDIPGVYTWIGAGIIVTANLALTYWESRRAK